MTPLLVSENKTPYTKTGFFLYKLYKIRNKNVGIILKIGSNVVYYVERNKNKDAHEERLCFYIV